MFDDTFLLCALFPTLFSPTLISFKSDCRIITEDIEMQLRELYGVFRIAVGALTFNLLLFICFSDSFGADACALMVLFMSRSRILFLLFGWRLKPPLGALHSVTTVHV